MFLTVFFLLEFFVSFFLETKNTGELSGLYGLNEIIIFIQHKHEQLLRFRLFVFVFVFFLSEKFERTRLDCPLLLHKALYLSISFCLFSGIPLDRNEFQVSKTPSIHCITLKGNKTVSILSLFFLFPTFVQLTFLRFYPDSE